MIVKEQNISEKQNSIVIEKPNIAQNYWQECLQIIKDNVDAQAYNTWFKPIIALSFIDNKLKIQLPSEWFREWLDSNYYNLINKIVKRVTGENTELIYDVIVVDSNDAPKTILYPSQKQPFIDTNGVYNKNLLNSKININYTFDNFVVGDSNMTAVNAAKAVAKELDNTRFNPLVIYGGTGLGKTHLVHAIGNNVLQNYPTKKVLYISSDTFINEFVSQVTKKDNKMLNNFNDTYRNVDLLIVDDIQFLSGKEATQDKFFHIFNSLLLTGKQIILTSDRPSNDLKKIDNRLSSRFIAGLNIEIKVPDFNHRKNIIIHKSRTEGITLPEDIVDYIAKNVTSNIRELQGTLLNILFRTSYRGKALTTDLVEDVVSKLTTDKKPITLEDIIEIVCMQYNVKTNLLEAKTRKKEIAFARQMVMFLARKHTNLSLQVIADRFNRIHATVIHACTSIQNIIDTNKKIKEEYEIIEAIIKDK